MMSKEITELLSRCVLVKDQLFLAGPFSPHFLPLTFQANRDTAVAPVGAGICKVGPQPIDPPVLSSLSFHRMRRTRS